jgi:hypothetical protein
MSLLIAMYLFIQYRDGQQTDTSSLWCHAAIGFSLEWCCNSINSTTSTATTLVIQACYHLLTSITAVLGYDDVLLPIVDACFGKIYATFTTTSVSTCENILLKQFQTTDVSTHRSAVAHCFLH